MEDKEAKTKPKIACIIQTRMGSSRLPGKVLKPLAGKPILWHVINRVKSVSLIDEVIIATTTDKKDDVVEEKAKEFGASVFRGSENDVLSRYYNAAKKANADIVIRITSDCPLVDPEIIQHIIEEFLKLGKDNVDYMTNREGSFPRGLDTEIFWFSILEKIFNLADKPYEREHVTPYIYQHPSEFRIKQIENDKDLSFHRWTVDTEEDYELLSNIYGALYGEGKIFLLDDVLGLFETHPEWVNINKHIEQKKLGG